jgi:hypothetical protein
LEDKDKGVDRSGEEGSKMRSCDVLSSGWLMFNGRAGEISGKERSI